MLYLRDDCEKLTKRLANNAVSESCAELNDSEIWRNRSYGHNFILQVDSYMLHPINLVLFYCQASKTKTKFVAEFTNYEEYNH